MALNETAPAVITKSNFTCTIDKKGRLTSRVEYEFLVNTKKGQEYTVMPVYYVNKKDLAIKNISVFDKDHIFIRKIKPEKMLEHSVYSYNMYEDRKEIDINVSNATYPYYLI